MKLGLGKKVGIRSELYLDFRGHLSSTVDSVLRGGLKPSLLKLVQWANSRELFPSPLMIWYGVRRTSICSVLYRLLAI